MLNTEQNIWAEVKTEIIYLMHSSFIGGLFFLSFFPPLACSLSLFIHLLQIFLSLSIFFAGVASLAIPSVYVLHGYIKYDEATKVKNGTESRNKFTK